MGANVSQCNATSNEMFEFLKSSETLAPFVANGRLTFPSEKKKDHYTFRLTIPNKTTFDQISCSVPVDRMGNREEDGVCPGGKSPILFETALVKDDKLIYVETLDYEDVQCFSSFQEIADEISRLITTDDSAMIGSRPFD
jgi:hypothetical protein